MVSFFLIYLFLPELYHIEFICFSELSLLSTLEVSHINYFHCTNFENFR